METNMLVRVGGIFLMSSAVAMAVFASGGAVRAQTALPEVSVTVASPIARRAPPRPSVREREPAPAAPAEPAPAAPPVAEAPLPGTLPIVTDQFATITVVPNEELRRNVA